VRDTRRKSALVPTYFVKLTPTGGGWKWRVEGPGIWYAANSETSWISETTGMGPQKANGETFTRRGAIRKARRRAKAVIRMRAEKAAEKAATDQWVQL
jgi:hypothetical protein